jgi:hypothetical protein
MRTRTAGSGGLGQLLLGGSLVARSGQLRIISARIIRTSIILKASSLEWWQPRNTRPPR